MRHSWIIAVLLLTCIGSQAQSANDLMAIGDGFDRTFQAAKALRNYLPAEKLEPQNVPLLLRIARQYRHLMTDASSNPEKLRLGGIALGYGQSAAALAPNDSDAQLSPACPRRRACTPAPTSDLIWAARCKSATTSRARENSEHDPIHSGPGRGSTW